MPSMRSLFHRQLVLFSTSHLDGGEVIKYLRKLLNYKKANKRAVIQRAFDIYQPNDGRTKQFPMIELLLKICLVHGEDLNKLHVITNDIKHLEQNEMDACPLYCLLLTCYIKSECITSTDCIELLNDMKNKYDSINLNGSFITKLISKCDDDAQSLKFLHSLIVSGFFGRDNMNNIIIKNTMINAYGKCSNELQNALKVFDSVSVEQRDVITMNNMMKVYIKNHHCADALLLYDNIQDSLKSDISHKLAISACAESNNIQRGRQIHHRIANKHNIHLKLGLIEMYGTFDDVSNAMEVFESIISDQMNIFCINAILSVLIDHKNYKDALRIYDDHSNTVTLNEVSYISLLKVCTAANDIGRGKSICSILKSSDYLNTNNEHCLQLNTSLMDFYGNCCMEFDEALKMFNCIPDDMKDIVFINCMIKVYITNTLNHNALKLFDECISGKYPKVKSYNNVSRILAIRACQNMKDFERGKEIIRSKYFAIDDEHSGIALKCSLIDFYGNCFEIERAQKIFESIDDKHMDIALISAMMNSFCLSNMDKEAIQLFLEYFINKQHLKLVPDKICYSIFFDVCTNCTSLHVGQKIHEKLKGDKNFKILTDSEIQSKLINMYGKCDNLQKCEDILAEIRRNEPDKYKSDISIWSTMMHAFGRNGHMNKVKEIYDEIKENKLLIPDEKIYAIYINACSQCGDIKEAENMWKYEINDDELKYNSYVITTLIDCLSKYGALDKAYDILSEWNELGKEDEQNDVAMWLSLLSGCRRYKNSELAQKVYDEFEHKMKEKYRGGNEEYARKYIESASILLANTYAVDFNLEKTSKMF